MKLLKLSTYILLSICVSFAVGNNDCSEYTTDTNCNMHDHCWWNSEAAGGSGKCVNDGPDEGPPECLMNCNLGFDTLNENSPPEEFCDILTVADTTTCGCNENELAEINCFSYMCGGQQYMDMDDCGQYSSESDCSTDANNYGCIWDSTVGPNGAGECHNGDDNPPPTCMDDCVADCSDFTNFTGDMCDLADCLSQSECMSDCTEEEKLPFDGMAYFCDVPAGCEDFFHMNDEGPGDGGDGDEGPPECLMNCEGIYEVDPEGDTSAFCTWLTDTDISSCSSGCDADELTEIVSYTSICTECLIAENCAEADLSTDEKNILLPEEFTLHPVYPNPFNPTTDIGFSLEYAGPVSISVYDVTGRQIKTILHNEFQNAGSHIITWNGSQFPSGIYFIHLQVGKRIDIQKVTLLK